MKKPQLEATLIPLPCPFCGKKPVVAPLCPKTEGNAWGAVFCANSKCAGQPYVQDRAKSADERGPGAYKDLAIRRWNRRKP